MSTQRMYSVFLRTASIFYVLYPLCICQCSGTGPLKPYFSFDQGWRKNIFIRPLVPYERLKLSDTSFKDNWSLNDYLFRHITVILLCPAKYYIHTYPKVHLFFHMSVCCGNAALAIHLRYGLFSFRQLCCNGLSIL